MKKRTEPKTPVQVSLARRLLKQIDSDPESKTEGRSAFITKAILLYMRAKREKLIDDQIVAALSEPGMIGQISKEVAPLIKIQAWAPDDDLVEDHSPRRRTSKAG